MTELLNYCQIQEKLETRLKEALQTIAEEENLSIAHNYQVYASKRGLNLQIQIQVRPKESI